MFVLYALIIYVVMMTIFLLIILVTPLILRVWVYWRVRSSIYTLNQAIPCTGVAVVLGAGLWADGSPTPVLYDRVATGVDLYKSDVVKKLLMSGDGQSISYNEPEAMRQLAIQLGVPTEDIILDYAGRRTYDSLFRAREVYNLEQAIVVTQRFHLDRTLYLCDAVGIKALGVVADRRRYRFLAHQRSRLREVAAIVNAWLEIHLVRSQPLLGKELPPESTNAGRPN